MTHSLTTIGRHLECAIQTELVVEPETISMPVCHMPERYKRILVGWHCAKVKSCVEQKIEKAQRKDL